ncbi:MAG TPA: 2'-5' RNA ligase family protein [Caldilineaceae bacterium]|nr:2'-5' RNA ligase family protein [Caldilineaceae bacterium]
MFICVAALLDDPSQNRIRAKTMRLMERYRLPATAVLLPQHVSLKMTFPCRNPAPLVAYFDALADAVSAAKIALDTVEAIPIEDQGKPSGLIWYNVVDDGRLRAIHNQLNDDLPALLGIQNSPIDGDAFRFHTTVTYGSLRFEEYQKIVAEEARQFAPMEVMLDRLSLFYSHEEQLTPGTFYAYRIRQLHARSR